MPSELALDRFVCFGDSLTELSWGENGLGASLAFLYQRRLDVLNRGLSGYNSDWALPCLKKWLSPKGSDEPKTQLMTIWLGANDAVLPGEPQHVPLARYLANLRAIVALVRDPASAYHSPETSLVLVTPTPYHPEGWLDERVRRGLPRTHDRHPERTKEYADAVMHLGDELGVPVADAHTAVMDVVREVGEDRLGEFFTDGLHLNQNAYAAVVEEVKRVILSSYPEKSWEAIPMLFPHWREIPNGALGPQYATADKAVAEASAKRVDPF
ncbi:SGNH/GDSL hydrolase family protein [Rhodotorula paludigena]|uniref:SGNH/GDSL hydrolase family protein n=1 Tax=Rhodotorula paludigena TaxID=86838 RepID=UPI00316EB68E